VQAFEQATAEWMDTVVLKDGSLSMIQVTVTGQAIQPVGGGGAATSTTPAAATESSTVNVAGDGGGKRKRKFRNLQEQQQPQVVYWEIDMDVLATYSGPDANFDLSKALDPLIQAKDDDWMRNLANAAPVFESLRPASMAAIFGDDQARTVASGMSTAGYVAVIIVSIMALSLGVAASVFVIKARQQQFGGDLLSSSGGKSLSSPMPSYNMSMEEYPLNDKPTMSMPVPPVSEQSENSPLRGAEVAPSPSSCCSSAGLEYLGCGGLTQDEDDEEEEMENKPPMSPNTMEKGRDNDHTKAAGGINLFNDIPIRKPPMTAEDASRLDPPSAFSEVDFGNDHRALFNPVTKKSLLLASSSSSNNQHLHHVPPSSILHNHPRDPSDRGIGSSIYRHPDPASSSRFEPMVSTIDTSYSLSGQTLHLLSPGGH
jgi:hypothetical protein